jgi:hypothetical protein
MFVIHVTLPSRILVSEQHIWILNMQNKHNSDIFPGDIWRLKMKETCVQKIHAQSGNRHKSFFCLAALPVCVLLALSGCVSVKPQQQRLVSKPNMQFSGSVVFSYQDRLLTQIESGSASSVGGQSGECGSCVSGGGQ